MWSVFVVLFSLLLANPSSAQSSEKFRDSLLTNAGPNHVSSSLDSESVTSEDLPEERSGYGPSAEGRSKGLARSAQMIGAAPSREMAPFSSWRVDVVVNTLGAGIDISTPLLPHFDLRGGGNFLAFGHEFDVDGLHYDARLQLGSGNLRLDWFPRRRNFHISPGILYFNNYVTAPSSVPAGAAFELGDESFINSVDDPVHGEASLKFPRRVALCLHSAFAIFFPAGISTLQFLSSLELLLPGAPKMNVTLTGTACQQDGCFSFADNEEAQQSLRDEVRGHQRHLERYSGLSGSQK